MALYHVNKNAQPTGEHEVHVDGCQHGAESWNRLALGEHFTCSSAVILARQHYTNVDGCFYCSKACHKR